MGLTLHYTLRSDLRSPAAVKRLVGRLREAADELSFTQVGPLVEYRAAPGEAGDFPAGLFHAVRFLRRRGEWHEAHPRLAYAFVVWPGPGCESAELGLARYPRQAGWSWEAFCKTQYASSPAHGGTANFLRCHLGLVALLDRAVELGVTAEVNDEGNYYQGRDAEALAREVGQWNEMLAGLGGVLKDNVPGTVAAPIFQYPDFEHLEARARIRPEK